MPFRKSLLAAALLPLLSCSTLSSPGSECSPSAACAPRVLLIEDFEGENGNLYALNYTTFRQWEVIKGTVDLVGSPPFDDFLPHQQGMYVDLDGTTHAAGTLQSRQRFTLLPGDYRLQLKLAGMPRPSQPPNTVIISLGTAFTETVTLESYAPLQTYDLIFTVRSALNAPLTFEHLGGDDYGIFIDDIRLERL
jgi:hypothetical protein